MDKKRMSNDKIIISASPPIHRLVAQMPEFNRRYGLWIINASFAVRSAPDGFARCPERKFEFYSISHLIEGGGRLWIEQQDEQELTPGTLVVITPGIRNRYGGNGLPYVEDSIRFCGPVADMMAASGILVSGAYELGTVRRLCPIIEQIADPSRDAQIHANIQLQNLLTELYFSNRERSRSSQMEELLQLIQNDLQRWWTVEELAELASLSSEVLRRRFLAHTGMLPKAYGRMQAAQRRRPAALHGFFHPHDRPSVRLQRSLSFQPAVQTADGRLARTLPQTVQQALTAHGSSAMSQIHCQSAFISVNSSRLSMMIE